MKIPNLFPFSTIQSILIFLAGIFVSFSANAGGGITHMFVAEEAIPQVFDSNLRKILQDHKDAYLTGAHYPDSGYIPGTGYGEDSHWDAFIYTFAEYIKEKYRQPEFENPRLVAFLMGCATHRVSDEIIHYTFYPFISKNDFNGNDFKAHKYGDVGIDMLLNIEKTRWNHHPNVWWVPVSDLLEVYHRMGLDQYSAEQIIYANKLLNIAGYLERLISVPTYGYLRMRMPWTAKHYYDWPEGGMLMDIQQIAKYQNNLWNKIKDIKPVHLNQSNNNKKISDHHSSMTNFAKQAFDAGIIKVSMNRQSDGSIELQPLVINDENKLRELISEYEKELIKNLK